MSCRPDRRPGSFGRRESVSFLVHPQIPTNASSDPCRGGLNRILREVGIAGGRLHLGVAQELPDHGKAFAESQGPGREGMAYIVSCSFRRFEDLHR